MQIGQVGAQNQKRVSPPARSVPLNVPPPIRSASKSRMAGTVGDAAVVGAAVVGAAVVDAGATTVAGDGVGGGADESCPPPQAVRRTSPMRPAGRIAEQRMARP